jgi:putative DNA primase/helicase
MIPEPSTPPIDRDSIPQDLKARDQWIRWEWMKPGGKWTKVPYQVGSNLHADSTNPATWSSFEATEGCERIGYMFAKDDPFCGVDLDNCLKRATFDEVDSADIEPEAQRIIELLDSYAEISPSGRGIHVLVRGSVPGKRSTKREKGVEFYDKERFFTVTGAAISPIDSIEDRQAELQVAYKWVFGRDPKDEKDIAPPESAPINSDFSDDDIQSFAFRAANGEKFFRLWNGDISGYPSQNEADLALCSMIAFWTGPDPQRIMDLFSQSRLNREKWRSRENYRTRTVEKVLAEKTEYYSPPRKDDAYHAISLSDPNSQDSEIAGEPIFPPPVSLGALVKPGPRQWLVDNLIPMKYPTTLFGTGGVAKSYLALSLGMSIAQGEEAWLGFNIKSGPVLYLDFELEVEEQTRRGYEVAEGMGLKKPPMQLHYECAGGMRMIEAFQRSLHWCKEWGIKLLIVDSTGLALEGDSERASDVIAFFREVVGQFTQIGTCVLLIDHQSKLQQGDNYQKKSAFGSAYKGYLARSAIQVELMNRADGEITVRFRHQKTNFGSIVDPFEVRVYFRGDEVTVDRIELDDIDLATEESIGAEERVLCAIRHRGDAVPQEVVELTGLALSTVRREYTRLKKEGKIEETGETREDSKVYQVCDNEATISISTDNSRIVRKQGMHSPAEGPPKDPKQEEIEWG